MKYIITKSRKRKRKLLPKKWRDPRTKAIHKHTEMLQWLQMSFSLRGEVNLCEHMIKTAPCESVFRYINSLPIKKDICDRQNVLVKLSCVCVCLSFRDLFIFWKDFAFSFPIVCESNNIIYFVRVCALSWNSKGLGFDFQFRLTFFSWSINRHYM